MFVTEFTTKNKSPQKFEIVSSSVLAIATELQLSNAPLDIISNFYCDCRKKEVGITINVTLRHLVKRETSVQCLGLVSEVGCKLFQLVQVIFVHVRELEAF